MAKKTTTRPRRPKFDTSFSFGANANARSANFRTRKKGERRGKNFGGGS